MIWGSSKCVKKKSILIKTFFSKIKRAIGLRKKNNKLNKGFLTSSLP